MERTKILVVDDDPNIRELISVNLTVEGYDVCTAANGREAVEIITSCNPALIVLDVMMPEIDGWEVCKFVKDNPALEHIKIVMLTAKGSEKDKMIGKEIFQANEYLTKPFDTEDLKTTIRNMLHA